MKRSALIAGLCASSLLFSCLRRNISETASHEGQLADVVINEEAEETLQLESTLFEEAVSTTHLSEAITQSRTNANKVELNLILHENWQQLLPLKLKSGDIKKALDGIQISDVVALGNTDVQNIQTNTTITKVLRKLMKETLKRNAAFDVIKLEVRVDKVEQLIDTLNILNSLPGVLFAEPNAKVKPIFVPNDPRLEQLWGLEAIRAPNVWKSRTGNGSNVVAVIDTGVDLQHRDLKANLWSNPVEIANNGIDDDRNGFVDDIAGWDFVDNDNLPQDDDGHGTHVAGTIGARGNNTLGIAGVNWNAKLMPIRVFGPAGGDWNRAFNGLVYAISNGANILSNSWGAPTPSVLIASALQLAQTSNRLVVAAAGNDANGSAIFPAYYTHAYPNIISVGSISSNKSLSQFSNFGDGVDVAAPGDEIVSTWPQNKYNVLSGTSMAAPHVAGAAALLWDSFPNKSAVEIKQAILNGSDYVSSLEGKISEARSLNVASSVNHLLGTATPRPNAPLNVTKGLQFSYYEGKWNRLPVFAELTPSKTGTTTSINLKPSSRNNHFALVFEGFVKIDHPGKYSFYLMSDDGSRIFLNDTLVADNDGIHSIREKVGSIDLSKGYQKIRIEYFQAGQGKTLQLEWSGPKIKRTLINTSGRLYYFL